MFVIIQTLVVVLVASLITACYLLALKLDCGSQSEIVRIRQESAEARRDMHALTRQAFVAMAEEAERRRRTL